MEQLRDIVEATGSELLSCKGGRHDAALTVTWLPRHLGMGWMPLRSSDPASFLAAVSEAAESRTQPDNLNQQGKPCP